MKVFTHFLISTLFMGCSQSHGIDTASNNTPTNNQKKMDIAFEIDYQQERNYAIFYKDKSNTLLTDKDISSLETIIKKSIVEQNEAMEKEYKKEYEAKKYPFDTFKEFRYLQEFKTYKFQLVPQLNTNGELEVWVNGLCSDGQNKWQKQIIHVMDGGPCYFNLKINLVKKTYYNLKVNGVS